MSESKCNICKSPWHEVTGHYISDTMRWCGGCTKDWVKELKAQQNRRWGGLRFYDYAKVPPPTKTFRFTLYIPAEKQNYFTPRFYDSIGQSFDEARMFLQDRFPDVIVPAEHMRGCWREIT